MTVGSLGLYLTSVSMGMLPIFQSNAGGAGGGGGVGRGGMVVGGFGKGGTMASIECNLLK